MVTKSLRIVVVERCPVQRSIVEKLLNHLGYFAVITTSCVDEAWALNQFKSRAFDVVVINVRLMCHPRASALTSCGEDTVQHLLVYGLHDLTSEAIVAVDDKSIVELVPGLPEHWRMMDFMARVEEGAREDCLYDEFANEPLWV